MAGSPARSEWLETVVQEHEGPLCRYVVRILGDIESSRDVVQEAFLKLCQRNLAPEENVRAWLFKVCRNRALDVWRKERRMTPLADAAAAALPENNPGPLAAVERQEEAASVRRELARIPANQQEVIQLKFQAGLSYREISEATGLSVSNVGYLIHMGLKALREKIAPT